MSKAIENAVDEKNKDLKELVKREYKEGFVTDIALLLILNPIRSNQV